VALMIRRSPVLPGLPIDESSVLKLAGW
jgi:hypothetical protein